MIDEPRAAEIETVSASFAAGAARSPAVHAARMESTAADSAARVENWERILTHV